MTDPVSYDEFRTGLTFACVFQILKREALVKWEAGERMFITRHTVLGRWRQIKLESYDAYCRNVDAEAVSDGYIPGPMWLASGSGRRDARILRGLRSESVANF